MSLLPIIILRKFFLLGATDEQGVFTKKLFKFSD